LRINNSSIVNRLGLADGLLLRQWKDIVRKINVLKIQRSSNGRVVFTLSGRIEAEDVAELQRLFDLEAPGRHLGLDLKDVTLVDQDAVGFLADCEANDIQIENCPPYIREWIERGNWTERGKNLNSRRKRTSSARPSAGRKNRE